MNVHKNARLTPHSRAELVRRVLEAGQAPMIVAIAMGVTIKTVSKWANALQPRAPMAWSSAPRGRIASTGQPLR